MCNKSDPNEESSIQVGQYRDIIVELYGGCNQGIKK